MRAHRTAAVAARVIRRTRVVGKVILGFYPRRSLRSSRASRWRRASASTGILLRRERTLGLAAGFIEVAHAVLVMDGQGAARLLRERGPGARLEQVPPRLGSLLVAMLPAPLEGEMPQRVRPDLAVDRSRVPRRLAEAGCPGEARVGFVPPPEAHVDLAHRERFVRRRGAGRTLAGHAGGDRGERREREQVEPVVLEDRRQWRQVAGAQVGEVPRRDLEPRHIVEPLDAEDGLLEGAEGAARAVAGPPARPSLPVGGLPDVPPPPELARRVQHVEVRHVRERRLEAMELVARLDERHVEGPAVEGHQAVEALRQRRERVEQLAFGLVAAEEELPGVKAVGVEEAASDQEGERSGAAAEARGLEVEEQQRPACRNACALPVVDQAPPASPLQPDWPRLAWRRRGPFVGRQDGERRQAPDQRFAVLRHGFAAVRHLEVVVALEHDAAAVRRAARG